MFRKPKSLALSLFAAAMLAAAPAKSAEIVLGSAPNLQTVPILVALDKGYFKEENLEIKLVKFVSGWRAPRSSDRRSARYSFHGRISGSDRGAAESKIRNHFHAFPVSRQPPDFEGVYRVQNAQGS